jgi:hypothetical protein
VTFNPKDHLMQFERRAKQKDGSWVTTISDYLPVQWRLVWFREVCPEGTITTEEVCVDLDREVEEEVFVYNKETRKTEKIVKRGRGYARFKATVTDGKGGMATGTKSESVIGFSDFLEKSETGAVGRALAGLGFGTQFAPELDEGEPRSIDTPVSRAQQNTGQATQTTTQPQAVTLQQPAAPPAQKRQQASTALPQQDQALRKMIANAKARCATVQVLWMDAKRDAGLGTVEDEALTVQQVAQMNGVISEYGKKLTAAS